MFTVTNNPDKAPTLKQLQSFYDLCSRHDWNYDYADDYRVWCRGSNSYSKLRSVKILHPQYEEIFTAWSDYVFRCNQATKPIRPE